MHVHNHCSPLPRPCVTHDATHRPQGTCHSHSPCRESPHKATQQLPATSGLRGKFLNEDNMSWTPPIFPTASATAPVTTTHKVFHTDLWSGRSMQQVYSLTASQGQRSHTVWPDGIQLTIAHQASQQGQCLDLQLLGVRVRLSA